MSKKKVFSEFTILFWAAFRAILGHMGPLGRGLDIPGRVEPLKPDCVSSNPASATYLKDPALSPGMCPAWEWNQQPCGPQASTQPTLSHTSQG